MRALQLSFNRHQLMRKACFAKANFIELLRNTLSRRRDGCRPDRFSPRPRQVRSPRDLHYRRRKKNGAHAPPRLPNAWHALLFCNQIARQADEIRAKRCFAQRRHGPPSARTNGTTCSPCNCSPISLALSRSNTFSTYTLCTAAKKIRTASKHEFPHIHMVCSSVATKTPCNLDVLKWPFNSRQRAACTNSQYSFWHFSAAETVTLHGLARVVRSSTPLPPPAKWPSASRPCKSSSLRMRLRDRIEADTAASLAPPISASRQRAWSCATLSMEDVRTAPGHGAPRLHPHQTLEVEKAHHALAAAPQGSS